MLANKIRFDTQESVFAGIRFGWSPEFRAAIVGFCHRSHIFRDHVVSVVVRRGCYKKEDLEEALDRAYEGEKFAAEARTSSIPLR
ncbi:hypothetical protein JG688_00016989, partial [Phytophthora aleatoria]